MSRFNGIGSMRHRITFQQEVYSSDPSNAHKVVGWENISRNPVAWAHVNERSGTEVFQADQVVGVTVAEITIRYRGDINIKNRIVFNSMCYGIQSIIPDHDRTYMKLTCESGGQYKEA